MVFFDSKVCVRKLDTYYGLVRNGSQFCNSKPARMSPKKRDFLITASSPWKEFWNQWWTDVFFFARRLTMAKNICTSTNQSSIKWKWNIFFSKMMNGTCQCIPWRIWRLHLLVRQIGGTEIQGLAAYWYIRRSKSGRSEFDFLQLGFAWQTEHTKDPLKIEEFHEIQIWNVEASRKQQDGGIWYTCNLPSCFKLRKLEFLSGKKNTLLPHVCSCKNGRSVIGAVNGVNGGIGSFVSWLEAIFQRACDQNSPVRFYYTAWLIGIHIICIMTFFKVPK